MTKGILVVIGAVLTTGTMPVMPAAAQSYCQPAIRSCQKNFPIGNYPQYSSLEECYEKETELRCPTGPGNPSFAEPSAVIASTTRDNRHAQSVRGVDGGDRSGRAVCRDHRLAQRAERHAFFCTDDRNPVVARLMSSSTGRSQADAPEIDGQVFHRDAAYLSVGDIVPVSIEDADEHDL